MRFDDCGTEVPSKRETPDYHGEWGLGRGTPLLEAYSTGALNQKKINKFNVQIAMCFYF